MGASYLGHNDNLISRDLELLESLPKDDLGLAVGVYIGSVKGVDSLVQSVRATNASVKRIHGIKAFVTHANLMCSMPCFSSNTHSCHSGVP